MKNLTTAIYSKLSGSALAAHVSNQLFKGRAPDATEYPYIVYMVVTDVPEKTFSEDFENVIVQFSLFSAASGTTELEDMYTDLKTLYDDQELTVVGSTMIWMKRDMAVFSVEDHETPSGQQRVFSYHVDYNIKMSLD